MASLLRAAVIGLGSMGANHARVLADLPGIDLVGVADSDPERTAQATARRTFPGFNSVAGLLRATQPDLVTIAVPTRAHAATALEAIAAGAHVLVEKPIAATIGEAQGLAEAAARAGTMLSVGHIVRFDPAIQALRERLRADQGGRVLQLRARRVNPFPERIRDVGVIHDLATHDIDIMRYLLGLDVRRVYAEAQRHVNTEFEDLLAGLLHFEEGVLGVLEINWLTPTKERLLEVLCERGMFVVDYEAQSLTFYENFAATAREGAIASVTEGPMTRYPVAHQEPLRAELAAFRDAVRDGGPPPVSPADAIAALTVAEALAQSANTGEPVSVAEIVAPA